MLVCLVIQICNVGMSDNTEMQCWQYMMTCRYLVLADYDPLSDRELGLRQTELVDLLKTGCAGWWFVRLVRAPYSQGWAPSTYLQQIDEMWEGRLPADN